MFAKLRVLFYFLCIFFISTVSTHANTLPHFQMADQYGKQYNHTSIKGKPVVFLGCEIRDVELCRKIGRKIYWKMQNLLWKDADKIAFLSYLNLKETNQLVEKYIEESKSKQFEAVLLDRKGELIQGLEPEKAFLRIFDRKGKEIHREYLETADDEKVKELYVILKTVL
ncbi:hypothetical protein LPTSP3_g00310 [Leptospira kobayashii]|uniref:Thioredoxin domain-containing protein n=1 Tax=Leptospira kobayashii TaxID=1917830 RepID=A0ABM7UFE0_9LEPT|nr:hypothetical protein [Leptospira kobayashii]BDA77101.1 hypothetical protein LPTSP3_g00310 [Leptospira kobayashii]